MTAISKNVYFDVLDDIVNKYTNTIHRTIKMIPIEVTDNYYAEYNEHSMELHSNKKNPKFKVSDTVRISKYKNIFAKGYSTNWPEEVFVINKSKYTVPRTCAISDLNGEEITGSFQDKELQKTSQKEKKYLIEQVITYMSNGEGMIIHLIVGLIKKISYKNESILS